MEWFKTFCAFFGVSVIGLCIYKMQYGSKGKTGDTCVGGCVKVEVALQCAVINMCTRIYISGCVSLCLQKIH